MSIPKHVLLFFLIVLSLSLKAQVFPVQGNVVLNPPYSPYLADLTTPGSHRFWLTLRLQDPTIASYHCKLRLSIEGVGITIRTKNSFLPQPITLEGGGIPQLFYGDDLAAYFNPANLDFAGLTRSQYERTQRLPEGVYRFTIEVLDYNRGTVVSNKIGTTAWIVLNDPPMLNLPRQDSKIAILEPTNIPFTWTPRHTASPNAAFTTSYTFRLIELAPNATSQSANAAFLSQPVLYETTLSQNQLVYGPAEPSLLAGRKYAWQVQATDTEGRDLFRNNGKSEVFVFQYGDALGMPRNVLQQGGNATTLSIQWELPDYGEMPAQYRIRYKPYTSPANNWFESVTTGRYYTIGELNPSTTYIVQVRSERGSTFSEYSAPLQMSTISLEERGYTCGGEPVLKPPTTTEILPRLFPGDEIKMHDFTVMVTKVEGSNGNYSGTGLMRVSLFNNASVKVRFSGRVNKHYELAGEIVSIPRKNSAMGQLVNEMEKIGADRKRAQDSVARATNPTPVAITITGIIDSVWVQDSVIIVLREDGTQEEIVRPPTQDGTPQQVVLTDSVGNSYTVTSEGNVMEREGISQNNTSITDSLLVVQIELIKEVLEYFKTEINLWLENNGKGPLEEELIKRIMAMPDCLPEDEEKLNAVLGKIQEHLEDTEALLDLLKEDDTNKVRIEELTAKLSGKQPPYAAGLSEAEWDQLVDMICPYFLEQEERPQLVSIEPITDNEFAAGIDNDKLEIKYSIDTTEIYPLTFAKIEIYKNDDTLVYVNSEAIEIGKEKTFAWDGRMNQGDYNDKYIRYDQSPFTIKIKASLNEDFSDAFEATTTSNVDEETDEWNDNTNMHGWVLCEGCSESSRYKKYKELKPIYKGRFNVFENSNPLVYFKDNITFDNEEQSYTFLNRPIRVHKNFYKILQDIEDYIKSNYGTTVFYALSNKYSGKIQDFSMRYVNNGSSSSSSISPHGLGLALDIEPKKNPQIIYNERPLVFFLLKKATHTNFNPGAPKISKEDTKIAHEKFLAIFKNISINELKASYDDIQAYAISESSFPIGELNQNIIGKDIDEIKTIVQEIKRQLGINGQISIIQTLSETVVNQIYVTKHKILELEKILSVTFNTVIFETDAKAAINYLDNLYIEETRIALNDLNNQMLIMQNEMTKPKPNYSAIDLNVFLDKDFSIDISRAESISNEYSEFITGLKQINTVYSNLSVFGAALYDQINSIGFDNVLLQDGFCDLDANLLESILMEAIQSQNTEWGGHYNSKKDWMHFGVNGYHYEDYVR